MIEVYLKRAIHLARIIQPNLLVGTDLTLPSGPVGPFPLVTGRVDYAVGLCKCMTSTGTPASQLYLIVFRSNGTRAEHLEISRVQHNLLSDRDKAVEDRGSAVVVGRSYGCSHVVETEKVCIPQCRSTLIGSDKPTMSGVLTDGHEWQFLYLENGYMFYTRRIIAQDVESQEIVLGMASLGFD
jgi:hypothetical protein